MYICVVVVFFFKQKSAYEMRISDWISDVCSSDPTAYSHQEMGIRAVADTCCRITSGIARMRLNRNDGDAFAARKSRRPSLPDCSDRLSLLLPKRLLPAFAFRFFFDACRLSRWPLAGCKTDRKSTRLNSSH